MPVVYISTFPIITCVYINRTSIKPLLYYQVLQQNKKHRLQTDVLHRQCILRAYRVLYYTIIISPCKRNTSFTYVRCVHVLTPFLHSYIRRYDSPSDKKNKYNSRITYPNKMVCKICVMYANR
jgi:hypothetical protein